MRIPRTAGALAEWAECHSACRGGVAWLHTLPESLPLQDVYDICPAGSWIVWALQAADIDTTPWRAAAHKAAYRAAWHIIATEVEPRCAESAASLRGHLPILDCQTYIAMRRAINDLPLPARRGRLTYGAAMLVGDLMFPDDSGLAEDFYWYEQLARDTAAEQSRTADDMRECVPRLADVEGLS